MLQDQYQINQTPKQIKLSSTSTTQPATRTLKSSIVNYKDSISHRSTDLGQSGLQNRSMQVEKKQGGGYGVVGGHGHGNQNGSVNGSVNGGGNVGTGYNWNREGQNQRESYLGASRDVKRISTQIDDGMHRVNQKVIQLSRTPVLRKQQSQYTRASQNIDNLTTTQRTNYQNQIQQLVNKIHQLQNQLRNIKSQNDHLNRSLSAPKQVLQRELHNKNYRIEDLDKRLTQKNREYMDKCLDHQKNLSKVTQMDQKIKKMQIEKEKFIQEIEKSKQNQGNLSKLVNQLKVQIAKLQVQRKKNTKQLQTQKIKTLNLQQQNKQLQLELDKIRKIKQLVKQLQLSDDDKAEVIKKHIAYEAQLIELNGVMLSNLETHKHDLKVTSQQHQNINKEIQALTNQIAIKLKDVLEQKQKVQDQLAQARAQTEKIRKTMFVGYQQMIAKLKDQIIALKQQNINLSNNSQSKLTVIKLERQVKILQNKAQDLLARNKQLQQVIERLKDQNKKAMEQISTQTSIRSQDYFDRSGNADLSNIIMNYQTRSMNLNSRIHQKQITEQLLKKRLEELELELQEFKDQAQLSSRRQKCDNDNTKLKIQSMKMELKAETQSLNRKIESLQNNIQRKNKQIKEKDKFITNYLIQKVKGQVEVNQIVQEIEKFFLQVK